MNTKFRFRLYAVWLSAIRKCAKIAAREIGKCLQTSLKNYFQYKKIPEMPEIKWNIAQNYRNSIYFKLKSINYASLISNSHKDCNSTREKTSFCRLLNEKCTTSFWGLAKLTKFAMHESIKNTWACSQKNFMHFVCI